MFGKMTIQIDLVEEEVIVKSKARNIAIAVGVVLAAVATIVQAACPFCL